MKYVFAFMCVCVCACVGGWWESFLENFPSEKSEKQQSKEFLINRLIGI